MGAPWRWASGQCWSKVWKRVFVSGMSYNSYVSPLMSLSSLLRSLASDTEVQQGVQPVHQPRETYYNLHKRSQARMRTRKAQERRSLTNSQTLRPDNPSFPLRETHHPGGVPHGSTRVSLQGTCKVAALLTPHSSCAAPCSLSTARQEVLDSTVDISVATEGVFDVGDTCPWQRLLDRCHLQQATSVCMRRRSIDHTHTVWTEEAQGIA